MSTIRTTATASAGYGKAVPAAAPRPQASCTPGVFTTARVVISEPLRPGQSQRLPPTLNAASRPLTAALYPSLKGRSPRACTCGTSPPCLLPSARSLQHSPAATVICFGDSLTCGYKVAGYNYPEILENLLQKAGYNLKVRNTGVGGETCAQLLMRLPYVIQDEAARTQVAFILILGGTNDILMGGCSTRDLCEKLEQMHSISSTAPGTPYVGVLTLPPARMPQQIQEAGRLCVNEALRESCKVHSKRFLVDLEDVAFSLSSDGIHYSPAGYQEFAQRAFQSMLPRLDPRWRAVKA